MFDIILFRYDCEDVCYRDLARMRDVQYMTWENLDLLKQSNPVRKMLQS